jgi:hypothetical protein
MEEKTGADTYSYEIQEQKWKYHKLKINKIRITESVARNNINPSNA